MQPSPTIFDAHLRTSLLLCKSSDALFHHSSMPHVQGTISPLASNLEQASVRLIEFPSVMNSSALPFHNKPPLHKIDCQ
jgi:hypothetical protein